MRWARAALALVLIGAGLFVSAPQPPAEAAVTYDMTFPVVGNVLVTNCFKKCGRPTHLGIDLMSYGVKGLPVVAVADGTVGWMHDNVGGNCCALAIHHDDGWTSYYIHLNNDTPGTDDKQWWGFAAGIDQGVHVQEGQLIGFLGDSGNAEGSGPHLHFELREPNGTSQGNPIDPYQSLLAAERLDHPIRPPVEATCDFDNDGYEDLPVGAPGEGVGSNDGAGVVHVFYGSAAGPSTGGEEQFHQGDIAGFANEAGDAFGSAVACGDFDADGFDDLAIGLPGEDVGAVVDAGSIIVMHGSGSGVSTTDVTGLHQNSASVGDSVEVGDAFGSTLVAGDFNGDLYVDLVVGAPGETVSGNQAAGLVHFFPGRPSGLAGKGSKHWSQDSSGVAGVAGSGDGFGSALAAGDIDDDGIDDLFVGSPGDPVSSQAGAGLIHEFPGVESTWHKNYTVIGFDLADGVMWHQASSGINGAAEAGDAFGSAIASGDFDGDGYDDVVVGSPGEDWGGVDDGGVNVIYGTADGLAAAGDWTFGQDRAGFAGKAEDGDAFGSALTATDVDDSGHDDVVVGTPGEDLAGSEDAGAAHLVYGSANGLSADGNRFISAATSGVAGAREAGDRFGASLGYGDFDDDGQGDVIVGIPDETVGTDESAGAFNVLLGSWITGGGTAAIISQSTAGVTGAAEPGDRFGAGLR